MNEELTRRKFFGVGLGALTAAGLAGCDRPQRAEKPPLDARFTYDISRYEHTDPSLLLYEETNRFATGFAEPKCLAVAGDTILVGGDKSLKTFDNDGKQLRARDLPAPPHAIAATGLIAFRDHFEGGQPLGENVHLTAIAQSGDNVYVADAGHREVLRCNAGGVILSRIKGFVVPSPYFDLHIGPDGLLWVVNPGKHRIEAYTLDGQYETGWGETAMNVEGFCGCCNPAYVTRLPDGRFVTSEKGLTRVKVYDVKGRFEGVVAGPEQLVKNRDLARRACANCQVGFGMPIAADSRGRVLVLDPVTKDVRIFTPKGKKT